MVRLWLARGLLVFGLVAGLVGMHGLGESAVFGCHAPASSTAGAHGSPGGAHAGPVFQHDASSHWGGDKQPAGISHDGVCKPLLPAWLAWLPVLACVALLPLEVLFSVGSVLWGPRTRFRSWWRAPPRAGRVCLVRVCVSRT